MGFSTADPRLCLGLTEELQDVASKVMLCNRCSVGFVRMRKEGVKEHMNRMPFQVGNVPPALQRAFVIQLLCEVLLDLREINDAFFPFHVLWHGPQTTYIQIVWGVGQNCWLLGPIPQLLNQNFRGWAQKAALLTQAQVILRYRWMGGALYYVKIIIIIFYHQLTSIKHHHVPCIF